MAQLSLLQRIKKENEIRSFFFQTFNDYTDIYPNHTELVSLIWEYDETTKNASLEELEALKEQNLAPIQINYSSEYGDLEIFCNLDQLRIPLKKHLEIDHKLIPQYQKIYDLDNKYRGLQSRPVKKPSFILFFIALGLFIFEIIIYNSGGVARTLMGILLTPTLLWLTFLGVKSLFLLKDYSRYKRHLSNLAICKNELELTSKRIHALEQKLL